MTSRARCCAPTFTPDVEDSLGLLQMCRRCFPVPKKRSIRSLPLSVKHKHEFVLNRRGMALYMVSCH